jgi:hypothetical protein
MEIAGINKNSIILFRKASPYPQGWPGIAK